MAIEIYEKHILPLYAGYFLQELRMQKQLSIFVLLILYYTSVAWDSISLWQHNDASKSHAMKRKSISLVMVFYSSHEMLRELSESILWMVLLSSMI